MRIRLPRFIASILESVSVTSLQPLHETQTRIRAHTQNVNGDKTCGVEESDSRLSRRFETKFTKRLCSAMQQLSYTFVKPWLFICVVVKSGPVVRLKFWRLVIGGQNDLQF